MYLIYCFIAYLSFSLHNATRNVAEIETLSQKVCKLKS